MRAQSPETCKTTCFVDRPVKHVPASLHTLQRTPARNRCETICKVGEEFDEANEETKYTKSATLQPEQDV